VCVSRATSPTWPHCSVESGMACRGAWTSLAEWRLSGSGLRLPSCRPRFAPRFCLHIHAPHADTRCSSLARIRVSLQLSGTDSILQLRAMDTDRCLQLSQVRTCHRSSRHHGKCCLGSSFVAAVPCPCCVTQECERINGELDRLTALVHDKDQGALEAFRGIRATVEQVRNNNSRTTHTKHMHNTCRAHARHTHNNT
jgi:hypothetical protein